MTEINAGGGFVEKAVDYCARENLSALRFHSKAPRFVFRRMARRKQRYGELKAEKDDRLFRLSDGFLSLARRGKRKAAEDFFGKVRPHGKGGRKRHRLPLSIQPFPLPERGGVSPLGTRPCRTQIPRDRMGIERIS